VIGAWLWRLGGLLVVALFALAGFELAASGLAATMPWLGMGAGGLLLLWSLADDA
jgi:hypothetical protein